ncbi:MAG TPA: chemotaxis protein CheX, partial [Pirellulales bacterium]|nr:chemotaxis protein CheX [Pirellulales bacterium]
MQDIPMRAEWINPFLFSLANTFDTVLSCSIERGALKLRDGSNATHEVSGIIGLTGSVAGMVVLSLSRSLALKAASTMLMTELAEIDDEVIDADGELTNMVAGAAKCDLGPYELSIGLPSVITGQDHRVRFPSEVTPIVAPYQSPWGPLT